MELVYLWVKNYKGILVDEEVNFGSEYFYSFKAECGLNSGRLTRELNNRYIKELYDSKISNISAFIGVNGSGKTTWLSIIQDIFYKENLENEIILIVREGESDFMYSHTSLNVKLSDELSYMKKSEEDFRKLASDSYVIYYSPTFDSDYRYSRKEEALMLDISTNNLLHEDKYSQDGVYDNDIYAHYHNELIRQVNFVYDKKAIRRFKEDKSFSMPNRLNIRIIQDSYEVEDWLPDNIDNTNFPDIGESFIEDLSCVIMNNLLISANDLAQQKETSEKKDIGVSAYHFTTEDLGQVRNIVSKIDVKKNYSGYEDIFLDIVETIFGSEKSEKNNVFTSNFSDFLQANYKMYLYVKENTQSFENNNTTLVLNSEEIIKEFVELYSKTIVLNRYLNFEWNVLSTGQKALLNIYSRFFNAGKKSIISKKKNIIVLVDESELYLHPEWQRCLMHDWISVITSMLSVAQNPIHLVLSSNSPYLISDLNSSCIVLLYNDENNNCRVNNEINLKSFGAHIHTIIQNDFFLNKGTIGEFSRGEIMNMIAQLRNEELDGNMEKHKVRTYGEKELFDRINLIDNDIVHRKMLSLYNNKYPKIDQELDEITRLKLENIRLKEALKKSNSN